MMAIISMVMAVINFVMLKILGLPCGYVPVEMKWLLISVMNGVVMVLDLKILGFGTQEEIFIDFKKRLEMMEIFEVVKDVMDFVELKKDLYVLGELEQLQMFEEKNVEIGEHFIMINVMTGT